MPTLRTPHCLTAALAATVPVQQPLNSADGSVVRNTKRYTLTRRVATATIQITIRGILRHGKRKNSDYGLPAQFGLTPKSKRGLVASDPGEAVDPLDEL